MKAKPLYIGLGVAAVIAVAYAYVYFANPKDSQSNNTQLPTAAQQTQSPPASNSTSGTYTDYTTNSIASTRGVKVLFFHAPWCPQCRQLDASIKSGQVPNNVNIFKVDYDSNQPLRQKYGVTIQTTLVRVDDSGNFVKKYVAYDDPTLQNITSSILQ